MTPANEKKEKSDLFGTLRGTIATSIPALSALVFIVVAVKVFRVSGMEATTTVAIVSNADTVALLKGVILTLLPGFLAALTATSLWWWAGVLPAQGRADQRKKGAAEALSSPQAVLAWALMAMAFFTVPWTVFFLLFIPFVVTVGALVAQWRGWWNVDEGVSLPWRNVLRVVALAAAAISIGYLTLSRTPWLPLRQITLVPKQKAVHLRKETLPRMFGAYVLSSDDKGTSLLVDTPRAVVQLRSNAIIPNTPLCIPKPKHGLSRYIQLRATQVLHIEPDRGSPYPDCITKKG